ncbi:MAG: cell division protein FtsQ/DivIB [Ignavibacteriales bacterium]|nr:cell division protein FtsQ/DivIB [Ignavibacteriales bacterium]MCF8306889.1 cell division protein FtsQ/DivIB [Ignavibacteriales bacterium]MCF8438165.1 cell division protein FtsQ/DivIB [Ignavibacteriales bacterium]
MSRLLKILPILSMFAFLALLLILALNLKSRKVQQFELIELTGNYLQSKDTYLEFTNLTDPAEYRELSLHALKDRFIKHPYISDVTIKYEGKNKVRIELTERKMVFIIHSEVNSYLLSEDLYIIPILPMTDNLNYPVITNPGKEIVLTGSKVSSKSPSLKTAYRINFAARLLDARLAEEISEIDLDRGNGTTIYFDGFDFPVYFGKGNEVKKMYYFSKLWKNLLSEGIDQQLIYIDLRFNKLIGLAGEVKPEDEII